MRTAFHVPQPSHNTHRENLELMGLRHHPQPRRLRQILSALPQLIRESSCRPSPPPTTPLAGEPPWIQLRWQCRSLPQGPLVGRPRHRNPRKWKVHCVFQRLRGDNVFKRIAKGTPPVDQSIMGLCSQFIGIKMVHKQYSLDLLWRKVL